MSVGGWGWWGGWGWDFFIPGDGVFGWVVFIPGDEFGCEFSPGKKFDLTIFGGFVVGIWVLCERFLDGF